MRAAVGIQDSPIERPERETILIGRLRDEISEVKECVSRYALQSMMFSAVALGASVTFYKEAGPAILLSTLPTLILLRTVSRTAIHKFTTVNRNAGYELHLKRSERLERTESQGFGWSNELLDVGWEEAMRAWRIVQPTIYQQICLGEDRKFWKYSTWRLWIDMRGPMFWRPKLPKDREPKPRERSSWVEFFDRRNWPIAPGFYLRNPASVVYPWYDVQELLAPHATYHPGRYLHKTLKMLHVMMYACLVPPLASVGDLWLGAEYVHDFELAGVRLFVPTWEELIFWTVVFFVFVLAVWIRLRRIEDVSFADQLESGINSIHSCAVLWPVVVLFHQAARERRSIKRGSSDFARIDNGYTYELSTLAKHLADHLDQIDRYVRGSVLSDAYYGARTDELPRLGPREDSES